MSVSHCLSVCLSHLKQCKEVYKSVNGSIKQCLIICLLQHLQTIFLPPPTGDDEVLRSQSQADSLSDMGDFDDLSDSIDLMLPDEAEQSTPTQAQDDPAKDLDPLPFPLYSLHAAKADALHKPCGTLPLVMYWGKRERPKVFNRQIGEGEKEREGEREREREREREADRQIERQIVRQAESVREVESERERMCETVMQRDSHVHTITIIMTRCRCQRYYL